MDSGEPPPPPDRSKRTRGERGGKAARKQKELRERTLRGEYVPKAWTESSGSKEVAVEKAPPVPPLGSLGTTVVTGEVVSLQERLNAVRAKAGLPTVSSFVSVVDTAEGSGASSSLGVPVAVPIASPVEGARASPRPITHPKSPSVRESLSVPSPKTAPKAGVSGSSAEVASAAGRGTIVKETTLGEPVSSKPKLTPVPPKLVVAPVPSKLSLAKASVPAAITEYRLSIDFHGVLNIAEAGDTSIEAIHALNSNKLREVLGEFATRGITVGITSYIGETGFKSQQRRKNLFDAVVKFNRDQPAGRQIGLRIVSTQDKSDFLLGAGADLHIDDKGITLQQIQDKGIGTIQITRYRSQFTSFSSLRAALDHVLQSRSHPRVRNERFNRYWLVPT